MSATRLTAAPPRSDSALACSNFESLAQIGRGADRSAGVGGRHPPRAHHWRTQHPAATSAAAAGRSRRYARTPGHTARLLDHASTRTQRDTTHRGRS